MDAALGANLYNFWPIAFAESLYSRHVIIMRMCRKFARLRILSPRFIGSFFALCCVTYFLISIGFYGSVTEHIPEKLNCLKASPSRVDRLSSEQVADCADGSCEARKPTVQLKSTFKSGAWPSWYASQGYHKHYNVNCSGIIHNNQTIIRKAYEMIREEHDQGGILLPCDETVSNWTKDCSTYRQDRRYPRKPLSEEEADYPLAYIIAVHKEAAQVERLLRAIYQPQNFYCIHADVKAEPKFHKAMRNLAGCFHNVFVASKLEDVQYAGFTRVQADINCMRDLVKYQWNYIINLCGQDFPLKTNLEITKQMKAYRGYNDIPGIYPEQTEWFVGRTRFKHKPVGGQVIRTNIKKPPPPHNAKMFFGNAYYAAGRPYVDYLLSNKVAKDLLEYLSDSLSPDEHYWATVQRYPGVPGGYPNSTWASNVRFIRWTNSDYYAPCVGKYVRAVCVIGAGFLPYLSKMPHIFLNKIHYDYDPITFQCLEEFLDYRTVFPDAISEYVPEYPLTNLFPWYNFQY